MSNIITRGAAWGRGRLSVIGLILMVVLGMVPVTTGVWPGAATAWAVDHADLVDLNSASLEEVLSLPIPEELARRIVEYRTYLRYFNNVYELREVDGMTPEYMEALKPLVATVPSEAAVMAELAARPWITPRLIYAELPTDVDVMNRLIDETVILGMQDIDRRPEFWKAYAQGMSFIKEAAIPLSTLLSANDVRAGPINEWLARQELSADAYLYLPVRGRAADGMMILHADTGYPVDLLAIDPW